MPEDSYCPWNKWPVIGQFSSIGTLGVDYNSWVGGEFLESMSMPSTPMSRPPIKVVGTKKHISDNFQVLMVV